MSLYAAVCYISSKTPVLSFKQSKKEIFRLNAKWMPSLSCFPPFLIRFTFEDQNFTKMRIFMTDKDHKRNELLDPKEEIYKKMR
jgi:hypothetical protein